MWSLERKIMLSACMVLLVAIGLGTLAWRSSVRADEASELVEHTYAVLSDIEAGQRAQDQIMNHLQGYLLTGDKAHLLRRDLVWEQWLGILGTLKGLTADNPRQQERLREVQKSLDARMAASRRVEDAYLRGRPEVLARVVADGLLVGDTLDKVLHDMRRDEQQLLAERKALELDRSRNTRLALIALLTIITAFPLFTLLRLRREYLLRKTVEAERATLTDIIEATPDILSIAGLDGRVSYLNPAGCARLGLDALKPGDSFPMANIKPAWSLEKLETEIIPQALKLGSWTGDGAFLSPTGQEIPVSQVVIAHRSALGVTISTIARDISAARQAEQVLAEAGKFELTHGKVLDIFNASFDRKEILQGTLDALAEKHPFPVCAVYLYDEWTGPCTARPSGAFRRALRAPSAWGKALWARPRRRTRASGWTTWTRPTPCSSKPVCFPSGPRPCWSRPSPTRSAARACWCWPPPAQSRSANAISWTAWPGSLAWPCTT